MTGFDEVVARTGFVGIVGETGVEAVVSVTGVEEVVDAEQESGFADLVAVGAVFEVADRADCEDQLSGSAELCNSVKGICDFC